MYLPRINAKEFTNLISLDPWEYQPVTIEEFMLSPSFLDLGGEIYARIFDILCYTFGDNPKDLYKFNDINFIGGIGCLSGDTKIVDTDGRIHYIRDLVNRELEVFCIDKSAKHVMKSKAVGKYSGKKPVYKIITESGREICATEKHMFYTDLGWKEAKSLKDRSILTINKVDFNNAKTNSFSSNISYNLKELVTNKTNNNQLKNSNDFNENMTKDLLELPMYNKLALDDLLEGLKTAENQDYDVYTDISPVLKSIGLRTGDLFSRERSTILKFKHGSDNYPNMLYDKVISVEYIAETDVYDLEVPEYENFMLYDGTIVHNSGKTYLGAIAQSYIFYKLCCLRDPRKYLYKGYDKPISLVNCAPSANKAQKLVYQAIRENVIKCEFFKKFNLVIQSKEIKKYNSNNGLELNIFSGSSTPNSVIGLNVFSAIIDESCFFEKSSEKDYFEDLYKGIKVRITSRFGDRGFVACLSSPMTIDDYAWRILVDVKKQGTEIILPKRSSIREYRK